MLPTFGGDGRAGEDADDASDERGAPPVLVPSGYGVHQVARRRGYGRGRARDRPGDRAEGRAQADATQAESVPDAETRFIREAKIPGAARASGDFLRSGARFGANADNQPYLHDGKRFAGVGRSDRKLDILLPPVLAALVDVCLGSSSRTRRRVPPPISSREHSCRRTSARWRSCHRLRARVAAA